MFVEKLGKSEIGDFLYKYYFKTKEENVEDLEIKLVRNGNSFAQEVKVNYSNINNESFDFDEYDERFLCKDFEIVGLENKKVSKEWKIFLSDKFFNYKDELKKHNSTKAPEFAD